MIHILIWVTLVQISFQSDAYCSKEDVGCLKDRGSSLFGIDDLPRREPGEVGDVNEVEFGDGRTQTVVTRARSPPLFELPDFLTEEECDHIVMAAKKKGLKKAGTFGAAGVNSTSHERKSAATFISSDDDLVLRRIQERIMVLTGLPSELVLNNEPFQVGMYSEGGYYNFHYDGGQPSRHLLLEKPCCQHVQSPASTTRCSFCRYVTVLMYLSDVEEGGETSFPLADKPQQSINDDTSNLEFNCEASETAFPAVKGNAVMWYNNIVDPELGWLGVRDESALHGGCPILKGEKWISNVWITAPTFATRNTKTIYHK